MTGLWLASYVVLWVIVVVICLLLIGILRQLGLIQRQLIAGSAQPEGNDTVPALEQDGPSIGSPLANLEVDTINGFGRLTTAMLFGGDSILLMFMSPMCEACQHVVEPLNTLIANGTRNIRSAVIMRADDLACRSFLSVFPLHLPVVCDHDNIITMGFGIHRAPFGLLYDAQGRLIRKGALEGRDDLLALLGDESASDSAQAHVFPRLVSSQL